jgi:hypothetical protein
MNGIHYSSKQKNKQSIMKKETHSVEEAIIPFLNEETIPVMMERLYPMLSVRGKKEVKAYWKENGTALTPEVFNQICDIAKEVTGVDIRNTTKRTKEISLAHFLVCFSLYYEFVMLKKATLNEICLQYLTNIKHSQIIYAVRAIEKTLSNPLVFELLSKFSIALAKNKMTCSMHRLVNLSAQLQDKKVLNEAQSN